MSWHFSSFLRKWTLNLPFLLKKFQVIVFVRNCPKKLSIVCPNTDSVFGQFRNSEIADSDWHPQCKTLAWHFQSWCLADFHFDVWIRGYPGSWLPLYYAVCAMIGIHLQVHSEGQMYWCGKTWSSRALGSASPSLITNAHYCYHRVV